MNRVLFRAAPLVARRLSVREVGREMGRDACRGGRGRRWAIEIRPPRLGLQCRAPLPRLDLIHSRCASAYRHTGPAGGQLGAAPSESIVSNDSSADPWPPPVGGNGCITRRSRVLPAQRTSRRRQRRSVSRFDPRCASGAALAPRPRLQSGRDPARSVSAGRRRKT